MSTIKTGLSSYARYVYHGPSSSSYKKLGSVSSGEVVTAFWREGSYLHIEYSVNGTSKKKRGCILASSVNLDESIPTITNSNVSRYIYTSGKAYTGPSSYGYTEADFGLPRGLRLKYVGQKINNYAYVEFYDPSTPVGSTPKKMRAYFYANNLGTAAFTPNFYNYENIWTNTYVWNGPKGHLANDYKNPGVQTKAFSDGIVYSKGNSKYTYNGYTITLLHAIGDKMYFTFYPHMDTQPSIAVGSVLLAGQDIHPYGGSGKSCTGKHVHLSIYRGVKSDNLVGYHRDNNGNKCTFYDNGTGKIDFESRRFFDNRKVFNTNGVIIRDN
ncbi:hypothetical protein [Vallitalea guaymasensis]|uniref:hypothetical protein n=1 Tax=Vallitalea guaymasensis TaxID=1185412 RepID=UPI000DE4CEC3|nr:hypothetical protein [Vallitalea guaymasensis]